MADSLMTHTVFLPVSNLTLCVLLLFCCYCFCCIGKHEMAASGGVSYTKVMHSKARLKSNFYNIIPMPVVYGVYFLGHVP